VVQHDQAAERVELVEDRVEVAAPGGCAQRSVDVVQAVLRQAGQAEVEDVAFVTDRELLAQRDALRVVGVLPQQLERARHLVVVGDGQQQAIDAQAAGILGLHPPDVVGAERRVVAELAVVQVRDPGQPERPLQQTPEGTHVTELDHPVQARQVLLGVAGVRVQADDRGELPGRVRARAEAPFLDDPAAGVTHGIPAV
jgi:hypothetical protein